MSDRGDLRGPRPAVRHDRATAAFPVPPALVLRRHVDLCRTATAICRLH